MLYVVIFQIHTLRECVRINDISVEFSAQFVVNQHNRNYYCLQNPVCRKVVYGLSKRLFLWEFSLLFALCRHSIHLTENAEHPKISHFRFLHPNCRDNCNFPANPQYVHHLNKGRDFCYENFVLIVQITKPIQEI